MPAVLYNGKLNEKPDVLEAQNIATQLITEGKGEAFIRSLYCIKPRSQILQFYYSRDTEFSFHS